MAFFRALESARPPAARLFDDPFAARFLSSPLARASALARIVGIRSLILSIVDRGWPGARSSAVTRTRLIDEALLDALGNGIDQVVILGVGFDARAHRLDAMKRACVFEVDHPDTLSERRRHLAEAPHVRAIPIDFQHDDLVLGVTEAGYDRHRRACFLWEGVTNYLNAEAVDGVMRWFGSAAPGSRVIFTYIDREVLNNPRAFIGGERIMRKVRESGEPWTFGFDPCELSAYLADRRLSLLEDMGAAEYRARYLRGPRSAMRGYEFYRIAIARRD